MKASERWCTGRPLARPGCAPGSLTTPPIGNPAERTDEEEHVVSERSEQVEYWMRQVLPRLRDRAAIGVQQAL